MLNVRLVNTVPVVNLALLNYLSLCFSDLGYRLVSEQIFGNSQLNEKLLSCVREWVTYERTLRLVFHSK